MAITREEHTGDGTKGASGATGTNRLAFTFPSLKTEDIKIKLNGVLMAASTYVVHTTPSSAITFNTISPATALQETTGAPKQGVSILIYRDTDVSSAKGVFSVGSSIRSVDLNNNQDQALFSIKEVKELVDDDLVRSTDSSWSSNDTEIASTAAINNRIAGLEWDKTTLDSRIDSRADARITAAATSASSSAAGSMSAADKIKLDSIEASADVTDATNVDAAGAVMNSDIDAKGELLVGDGSGDPAALPVGANGYILKADSTTATGLRWAVDAGAAGGEQNVQADFNETDNTDDAFIKNKPTIPTNNNQLTNGAGYITATLTNEQVQDIAGPLVATGGTKTGISVTYDDANGNMDFVVASQTDENFTTADHAKLDGIEASADVTDAANVKTAMQSFTSSVIIPDNIAIRFGADSNLRIFHDANDDWSYIRETDDEVQGLRIQAQNLVLEDNAGDNYILCEHDGKVILYHDAAAKLQTQSYGIEVRGDGNTGDGTLQLNCSQNSHGIKLKSPPHSAGQSYTLTFPSSIVADNFLKTDANGNLSFATPNELHYNGVKKLESTTYGVSVTGNLFMPDSTTGNTGRIKLGDQEDLQIYHTGSHATVDSNTGDLYLRADGTVYIQPNDSESAISCIKDGAVEISYDNAKKFETTSTGIKVDKVVTIDGSTPRLQMKPTADEQSGRIEFFNTADTIVSRIYGDPATGSLSLEVGPLGNEMAVKCIQDAAVEIYHNGVKKLQTDSHGITVSRDTGDAYAIIRALQNDSTADAAIRLLVTNDDARSMIQFGDSSDADVGRMIYEHRSSADDSLDTYVADTKILEVNPTGLTVTGTVSANSVATSANGIRNITTSTADPTSSDGANGDVWLKYTP